jgi:hypothetical protein
MKVPWPETLCPQCCSNPLVKQQHKLTHLRKMALEKLLGKHYFIPKLPNLCP